MDIGNQTPEHIIDAGVLVRKGENGQHEGSEQEPYLGGDPGEASRKRLSLNGVQERQKDRKELSWWQELCMQRPWGREDLGASGKGGCQHGWNFETWNQGEGVRHWPPTPFPFPLRGTSCRFSTKITILIIIDNPKSTPTPEGALHPFPREGDSRGGSCRQHFLSLFFVTFGSFNSQITSDSSHQGKAGMTGSCEIRAEMTLESARA